MDIIFFQDLTYLRIGVNVAVSILLGTLFLQIGDDGNKIFDNYNLLFSILMQHVGSTLMLNIINCEYLPVYYKPVWSYYSTVN